MYEAIVTLIISPNEVKADNEGYPVTEVHRLEFTSRDTVEAWLWEGRESYGARSAELKAETSGNR